MILDSLTLKAIGPISIELSALVEEDPDLSWDEDGSTLEAIDNGEFMLFVARVQVMYQPPFNVDPIVLGEAYLGNCVYESLEQFAHGSDFTVTEPDGRVHSKHMSYCRDMMSEAMAEARQVVSTPPLMG